MLIIAALTTATAVIYAAVARFWPGVAAGYTVGVAIALYVRANDRTATQRRGR
jgi:hypothetical protein